MKRKDLFEDYTNIPQNVQEILDKYSIDFEDGNYKGLRDAQEELEEIGYTFSYYVDGQAYGLRPINVPLSDLEGHEETEMYYIHTGHDHMKNVPIYRVESTSENPNEYVGEWYEDIDFAKEELKDYVPEKIILTPDQEEQFQEWKADGNVGKFEDGYGTQDAQYRNRLKTLDDLRVYFYNEFLRGQSDYYSRGGGVENIVKKDRYGNDVKIGDAIHIRVLTGRYGQTKDYQGIVTGFDKFGNVELDGERKVNYTADYKFNDYEHGHHIWVEKINPKDIQEKLRIPKKFVPTFSSRDQVYGEDINFRGTREEFKQFLKNKYPNSVFGEWNSLYNQGWKYIKGNYISPYGQEYDAFDFYQSEEQGQGYLFMLLIPKANANSGDAGKPIKANVGLAIAGAQLLQQYQDKRREQRGGRGSFEDRGLDYRQPQYYYPAPQANQPIQQNPSGQMDQQQLMNALMMSKGKFKNGGMPELNETAYLGYELHHSYKTMEEAKKVADDWKSKYPFYNVIVTQDEHSSHPYNVLYSLGTNMGKRVYSEGGMSNQKVKFKHWSGDIRTGYILGKTENGDYDVQYGTSHVLVKPNEIIEMHQRGGYPTGRAWTREHYHDNEDEDYEVDPRKRKVKARNRKYDVGGFVPNGYVSLIFNNERHDYPAKYAVDQNGNEQLEDVSFAEAEDFNALYRFISKEFDEWYEYASPDQQRNYEGDYDDPAPYSKSGAIDQAIEDILYYLIDRKKSGQPAILNLDKDESYITEAFYKNGGNIFKSFEDFGKWFFGTRKKSYPTGRAWTREHYHDNDDEDYEVDPRKRKVRARNRKYSGGGGIYMSGEDYYNKLSNYSDIELLKEYCEENGLDATDTDNQERIANEREEVIDELVADYVRMMNNTGRFTNRKYDVGGFAEGKKLYRNANRFARRADDTGKGINEGYVYADGEMYFETEQGLINFLRQLDWVDADGNSSQNVKSDDDLLDFFYREDAYYYTTWDQSEIADQGFYYTEDGEMIEMSARGGYPTGRAWTREHYHDNENEDYEVDPKSRVVKARNRKYDVGGNVSEIPKSISASYYKWGQYQGEDDTITIADLKAMERIDYALDGFDVRDEDDDKIFFAYERDIDEDEDGISVKRSYAVDEKYITDIFKAGGTIFKSFEDFGKWFFGTKKSYPTGRAWTREHYHDNEDEDYEVDPRKRKVKARNRKYELGGTAEEETFIYEDVEVPESRTVIYADELDEFIDEWNDTMETNYVDWEDFNAGEEYYRIMPLSKFKGGGTLIGDQYKIDMNKNGRIDAEDFKILRSTMNGAWRNEHKHVNHSEDWETRYAKRTNSSRTGYKGRKEYGGGGGVSKREKLSYYHDKQSGEILDVNEVLDITDEDDLLDSFIYLGDFYSKEDAIKQAKSSQDMSNEGYYAKGTKLTGSSKVDADLFNSLKKDDLLTIEYDSPIKKNNKTELKVLSKTLVNKNKPNQVEKITLINTNNPDGAKYYAYRRKSGDITMAFSDMAIYNVKVVNEYAKGTKLTGKGSRAKNTYNKEVDAYKWFVVSDANDIDSGWEYKSDAQDQANEFNEGDGYQGKKWKVMSLVTLKKKNLADPRENWKYKAEFGALLLGAGVGAVLGNEIAKSGIKGTASKIHSRIKDDYADFKQASQKKKIDKFETGGKPKVVPYKDLSTIKPDFVNDVKKKVTVPEITLKKTGEVIEFEGFNKRIGSSLDVDKILRKIWNTDLIGVQEEAYVIFLNQANKPIGYYHHSTGAINLTVMDVEIVSAMAIKSLSKGVIIAHNHPSGEKKPSSADVSMTKNMKTALGLFNIELVDHMIITKDGYYSFLDNGTI